MNMPSLSSFIQPISTSYLPFFIIEFKSCTRHGSTWATENQAAAGGATCVNSLEKLFSVIDKDSSAIDSISFSCIMNERSAAFWMHYCDKERGKFFGVEIQHFYMEKANEIKATRNSIKNIVGWAIKERLPSVMNKLSQFQPIFVNEHGK